MPLMAAPRSVGQNATVAEVQQQLQTQMQLQFQLKRVAAVAADGD